MTYKEYRIRLHELTFASGMSARYHQIMEWRYMIVDRAVRILIFTLTGIGMVLAVPGVDHPYAGLAVAILSFLAAVALAAFPFGDREKHHGTLFSLWVELRSEAEQQDLRTCASGEDVNAVAYRLERLGELSARAAALDAKEPAPWPDLLRECLGDEIQREYGDGVRTYEAAMEVHARARATSASASGEEVVAAVAE